VLFDKSLRLLSSFHHRFAERILTFIHKIIYVRNSPSLLKTWIQPTVLFNNAHELRSNQKRCFQVNRINSKFGDFTFQNFFSKFLNNIDFINVFDKDFRNFSKQLDSVKLLNVIEKLFKLSCKFDTHLKFYFYFEKKNIEKT